MFWALFLTNVKPNINYKTCLKNASNLGTIDIFLTNYSLTFENTATTLTDVSHCHKLVLTALKITFPKNEPKELFYQTYKKVNLSNLNDD